MTIGERINMLVKENGVSLHDVSRGTGLSVATISRIISGKRDNPQVESVRKIAAFFNVTVSSLIGEQPMLKNVTAKDLKKMKMIMVELQELISKYE